MKDIDLSSACIALAKLSQKIGQTHQATDYYRQALSHVHSNADSHFELGVLLDQQGQYRDAIKHYRQAIFIDPQHWQAYSNLGGVLVRLSHYSAAEALYQHAITIFPTQAAFYHNLGQLLWAQHRTPEALTTYHQALALAPDLGLAHRNLGLIAHSYQAYGQAQRYLRRALLVSPAHPNTLDIYADGFLALGQWLDFLRCCKVALHQQIEFVESFRQQIRQLSPSDLLTQLQISGERFLSALHQAPLPLELLTPISPETLTAISDEYQLVPLLAQFYAHFGELSLACGAPTRAIQAYERALALAPSQLGWHLCLGDCLIKSQRRSAAIAIYQIGWLHACAHQDETHSALLKRQLDAALALPPHHKITLIRGVYPSALDWCLAYQTSCSATSDLAPRADLQLPEPLPLTPPDPACGGVTCQRCMKQLIQQFQPAQIGHQIYQCSFEKAPSVNEIPHFVATIPQGRAWVAPQHNAWQVCNEIAIFTPQNELLADISRAYPGALPGCQRQRPGQHRLAYRTHDLPPIHHLTGKVAILTGLSGHIYYHWMFDILPRFNILRQTLAQENVQESGANPHQPSSNDWAKIDYFVVNNIESAFQRETLAQLGVPLEKVIASDHFPHIQADELWVPSFAGHLDWVPPSSLDYLRQLFLKDWPITESDAGQCDEPLLNVTDYPKRIYISRNKARYRHVLNETEIVDLLRSYGFVSVSLETLTVQQQVQLFAHCEVIVAPHGSGLTNLAFCSPGTQVVECFSPRYLRTDYWMISQYLGLKHYYLVGDTCDYGLLRDFMYPSSLTEDFGINVDHLQALLDQLGL
jgi:tetratricopeptide (TPR) repeat protein/capsular polysaccharide biosynthesis protein